ncbi:MAG: 4Fe-4S dicluster domain-containing protein, partial [Calditrichaeota bacterium]|nr:4Fe-4S dicluster domain-containing protein [Calditrichota bacterium]
GIGASLAGARTLVAMKHVGVNVALDPLMTFAYTGAVGGFVLVSADDPAMHSSQNEQDNRILARFAKIPMLEPSDSAEAHDMVRFAFDLSEEYQTPVMLRVTTRISHAKGIVTLSPWPDSKESTGFKRDISRFVMVPQYARPRHTAVEERLTLLKNLSERSPLNFVDWPEGAPGSPGRRPLGVVTGGIAFAHVREVLPDVPVFKIGFSNPLPIEAIRAFAVSFERLIVVEELEPFYEEQLRAAGIDCEGKRFFPLEGELDPDVVREGFLKAVGRTKEEIGERKEEIGIEGNGHIEVLPRPPVLCAGCPHRPVFNALKKLKADVFGDIGCYTLGALAPLKALHACVCMGASVGMAAGVGAVGGSKRPVVGVIGDSTFLHSGITGLLDAVYNKAPLTLLILDNRITAMTGGQQHPGSGITLQGTPTIQVNYVELCRVLGVRHIYELDAYDYEKSIAVIKEATSLGEPAVVITNRPCMLYPAKRKYETFHVLTDVCNGCAACIRIGCPAIELIAETTAKGLPKVAIKTADCTGCSLCQQVCPVDAIVTANGGRPVVFEGVEALVCNGNAM